MAVIILTVNPLEKTVSNQYRVRPYICHKDLSNSWKIERRIFLFWWRDFRLITGVAEWPNREDAQRACDHLNNLESSVIKPTEFSGIRRVK